MAFFDTALQRDGDDGINFTRYLAPKWLMKHVPMMGSAYAGPVPSALPAHRRGERVGT